MSFVSGIMMGASIGSTIHDVITAKKKANRAQGAPAYGRPQANAPKAQAAPVVMPKTDVPEFALASSIAGRRRYRMAVLVNNAPLGELLEKQLFRLEMVVAVQANPVTGSLLIQFDASEENEVAMNNLMEKLRQRLATVEHEDNQPQHEPTSYAKSWSATGTFLNKQVRRMTGDSFDISALISMVFLIRGIRNCLVLGQRPTGPSMIWWALHLMKGWRG